MDFQINGVNFENKGAELMLHAVNQEIHSWSDKNTLSLPIRFGSFQQRNEANVNHLLWRPSGKFPVTESLINVGGNLTPKPLRNHLKVTTQNDIDAVLDASGFYFGDQWGPETTESSAQLFSDWKKKGKKVILLPQAFGPFSSERIRSAFNKLVESSDLVFARDKISLSHALDVAGSMSYKIKLAPDFTNLLSGILPSSAQNLANRPCIIPNAKMMAKASEKAKHNYIPLLAKLIDYMSNQELKPFILIHEVRDTKLAQEIVQNLDTKIEVIQDNNPLHIKGIIGNSAFVISSRFHGLVSSLSQGVPCLGTGWSHKYQELFNDYNCADLLLSVEDEFQAGVDKLSLLIESSTREEIANSISQAAKVQKDLSHSMWSDVQAELS